MRKSCHASFTFFVIQALIFGTRWLRLSELLQGGRSVFLSLLQSSGFTQNSYLLPKWLGGEDVDSLDTGNEESIVLDLMALVGVLFAVLFVTYVLIIVATSSRPPVDLWIFRMVANHRGSNCPCYRARSSAAY